MKELQEKIKNIIEPILTKHDCYIVELKITQQGNRNFLKIFIQDDKGISLDKISLVTKDLNNNEAFDALSPEGFRMEISSPGADYPLKLKRDFIRNKDRILQFFHTNPDFQSPINGKLGEITDDYIIINLKKSAKKLTYQELNYAKVIFEI